MAYKVISRFKDLEDDNTLYDKGDTYPKGEHKPSKERIEELLSKHPKYKRAFIEEVREEETKEDKSQKKSSAKK